MKRKLTFTIALITALVFLMPSLIFAQEEKEIEKKVEKKIKIVTVDEKGEKTIIDTVLTGDEDIEKILSDKGLKWVSGEGMGKKVIKSGDENIFIYSNTGDKKFDVYMKGDKKFINEEGDVYMIKKGDKDSFSIISIDEESADKHKNIVIHVTEDEVHTRDGKIIMERSKGKSHAYVIKFDDDDKTLEWVEEKEELEEGQVHIMIHSRKEMEEFVIKGDAVITIKDGKVKVEGDGVEMHTVEGSKSKEAEGKKHKK